MKAIILAAGTGSRMKPLTNDLPKCLAITLQGKTLLEIQRETLSSCGIREVVVVRGFQSHKIDYPGIQYYENREYEENNILESLFCAEPALAGDVVISYGDIWYAPEVLQKVVRSRADIAIGVDIHWKEAYVGRINHPLSEAEIVVFDGDQKVAEIGKIAKDRQADGEFIGLMKLSGAGSRILKENYHRAKAVYDRRAFQRAAVFKKAYLTDLLQEMAAKGIPIHCEILQGGWREIDTLEDLERVKGVLA